MSKMIKRWLIAAASLVVLGGLIFVLTACAAGWDFSKFGTGEYETNTYEITEPFNNISIKTDTTDVEFVLSNDGKSKAVCYEEKNEKHSVTAVDGVLAINVENTKKWYENIGINIESPKITLYLSKAEYASFKLETDTGDVKIPKDFKFESVEILTDTGDVESSASVLGKMKMKATTGDLFLENTSVGTLDISVTTGDVTVSGVTCEGDITIGVTSGKTHLKDVTCKNITSTGNTGDISLNSVIATEKISIERSTGDVKFDRSDATEIFVKTDTGDVEGNLLTDKIFFTRTDTGDVEVPKLTTGGKCEITTDTGDIKMEIRN